MTSDVSIRIMQESDLPQADELRAIAGWNQLPADWRRVLRYQPAGCFVAEQNGAVVGTVTTTSYGTQLAWIGMMLVHPDHRRQGIASALMTAALSNLRQSGVKCIKLDATPAGEPVYRKLNFQPEWVFHRWLRTGHDNSFDVRGDTPSEFTGSTIDTLAFGTERTDWLQKLAGDSRVISTKHGFGMMRPGRLAAYLGPVTAEHPDAAAEIIRLLLTDVEGPVIWDVPGPNEWANELVREFGFEPIRDLTRMWTGQRSITPQLNYQFALADPGTG